MSHRSLRKLLMNSEDNFKLEVVTQRQVLKSSQSLMEEVTTTLTNSSKPLSIQFSFPVLRSGSTIGLQLNQNNFWLCCFAQTCYGGACPGKFFEGNERRRCYGEVFRIYRARGPGHIVNGDFVGIYYVAQRTWFSMYRGKGGKSSCPGIATAAHGFADLSKWFLCGAEVFQIFAKGKQMGERITDQDDVALYTPCALQTVHFTQPRMTFSKCMMKATNHAFPINDAAFDKCPFESVEITIFD